MRNQMSIQRKEEYIEMLEEKIKLLKKEKK